MLVCFEWFAILRLTRVDTRLWIWTCHLSVFLLLKAPLRISDTTRKMIINQQVLYIIEMSWLLVLYNYILLMRSIYVFMNPIKVYRQRTEVYILSLIDKIICIEWYWYKIRCSCFIVISNYLKVVICKSMTPFIFWGGLYH